MESNGTMTDEEDEFECGFGGSLSSRLACILSYGGSLSDIIINYTLVVLNVLYCSMALQASLYKYSRGPRASEMEVIRQRRRIVFADGALAFVVLFQIVLCLALSCSGVSIIWCAMCGWIMCDRLRRVGGFEHNEITVNRAGQSVILMDFVVIGYYGVMFPLITTIAHCCALSLGAVLAFISARATTDFQ